MMRPTPSSVPPAPITDRSVTASSGTPEISGRAFDLASPWVTIARRRVDLVLVTTSLLLCAGSWTLAFLLRFDFELPPRYATLLLSVLPIVLFVKLLCFYGLGVYRIHWPYFGLSDVARIGQSAALATGAMVASNFALLPEMATPRSVFLADAILTFTAVTAMFCALRKLREVLGRSRADEHGEFEPIFIVGAGDAGEGLLRELQRNPGAGVRAVGFLDDAPEKRGTSIRGVLVLGPVSDARRLAVNHGVRKAYVAIPSAGGDVLRKVASQLLAAQMAIKVLPPLSRLSNKGRMLPQLRDVQIEDLLRRPPSKLDMSAIGAFVGGKVVLVTGAAGSIGSEICRQVLDLRPARLIMLDVAETPMHDLYRELTTRGGPPPPLVPELADITDAARIASIFAAHKPEVVFHAAAYKHVPVMEWHPREAVRVNVGGTRTVVDAAAAAGCGAFVLISTDKAVNPTSVMGATKRIAESLVRTMNNRRHSAVRNMSVRFGNVLGSNGSVLPIFKQQLSQGGPLTVTHPDMRRYFMTIPEAVQLVLQAAVLGQGGETFLLEMGEPVRILDLAEDLIRLSGLIPNIDVKIEFTGVRPGEKLFEELRLDNEVMKRTAHTQVYSVAPARLDDPAREEILQLESLASSNVGRDRIVGALSDLVPDFQPLAEEGGLQAVSSKRTSHHRVASA